MSIQRLRSFTTNWDVIVAIIMRETLTRFGKNKIGYLWALLEPVAYVSLFLSIRNAVAQTVPFGDSMILFVLSGLLCFRAFSSIASRGLKAVSSNNALFTYPMVKPMDAIFARIILEAVTMLVVFAIFFSFMHLASDHHIIAYPERFGAAMGGLMVLAAGMSVFNGALNAIMPSWERVFGMIRLPLLLLSGVFYVPKVLPPEFHPYLEWNPLLNCVEWFRYAMYLDYDPMLSQAYVIAFGVTAFALGMLIERAYRRKVMKA
ncbi:ABC transporter permease [Mesorhizobium sp. SP-1A]|uniref:ABC transporter permease n=1 Tax=Mesorhizobium sp. SP-1A TaxID=3077840 RepID=UPI0028F73DB3|nr:ABC transporter permease [Mesorhizobium sp. SP-1A]